MGVTSSMNFRSWDTARMQPGNSLRSLRTAGQERGLKFRVGSSSNSTLLLSRMAFSSRSLARWPPDRSLTGWLISSVVYFMLPR